MLIAQISDLHIVEKDSEWLAEPSTQIKDRLLRTIAYLHALDPKPDLVLLTGDVTDEGTEESYEHLRELLAPLQIPLFMIPGNHDKREAMRRAFSHKSYIPKEGFIQYAIDHYPLRFIGLDTLVEGKSHGNLSEKQIAWLRKTLDQDPNKPTLIFMHHPPIKIGMHLFDTMHCHAPSSFERLVKERDNIIGVVSGHYHHLCVSSFGGKLCFLAPSVAPVHYFAHPEHNFVSALELEDPGITLHKWHGGTVLTSHVARVKPKIDRIDWSLIKKKT